MAEGFPRDLLSSALNTLAVEDVPPGLVTELTTALSRATATTVEQGVLSVRADGQPLAECSPHGSLTFFVPPCSPEWAPRLLATLDRIVRILLLLPSSKVWHPNIFL